MKYLRAIQNTLHSFSSPHPLRDWLVLLAAALLTLAVIFGASLYLFVQVRSEDFLGVAPEGRASVPRIQRQELERLVGVFEARRLRYEGGEISAPDFSDPSR